ncbi:biotin--[acetyl-CoA-carboxylase] ligase [bacterium]|nr:biotin--[acetyl-CoA-carboxylase] ligase [bacterium]
MRHPAAGGPVHRDWFGLADFRPGARFVRDGAALYLLDEVGSTNDFLLGRGRPAPGRLCTWDGWGWNAAAPASQAPVTAPRPGTVVVARVQTDGHGRQGRRWRDCGGLHLSVVVPRHRAAVERGVSVWLGLITALVLREDFHLDARLKWPNDIMVRGRKLGGILLQRSGPPDDRLVIGGLGLNLTTRPDGFPADLQGRATSILIETGRVVRPGEVGGRVIARVDAELDRYEAEGWEPYRGSLALLDCLLGHDVQIIAGEDVHFGRAVGIDDAGALRVAPAGGGAELRFRAGDVHLVPDRDRNLEGP